jgi:uncharacterized coiled-coil protein SlyX
MPEYLTALAVSAVLGGFGLLHRRVEALDYRIDKFEVKVAETYVTKEDLYKMFDKLGHSLERMEDKLDAHVSENRSRISDVIHKYNL